MWWQQRRPEIVEDFEREIIGRVPKNVPKVTWEVTQTENTTVAGLPVIAWQVIGHVDNSAFPAVTVDISDGGGAACERQRPVPVLMMFSWGTMPGVPLPRWPEWLILPFHHRLIIGSPLAGVTSQLAPHIFRPTTVPDPPRELLDSPTKADAGRLSKLVHCARGRGALHWFDYLETLPAVDA